ncbi:MAG: hypothetical protein JWO64_1354 [Hyphomicrobiales bacterium]|nr:hypothetical protein [Hyphomicrobiales bacterium]
MSEPVAKPRYYGEPRNGFDLEEIERRMRESIDGKKPAPEADPLAELARLVGQANNDAFSKIFDAPASQVARPIEAPPISAPSGDQLYAAAFEPYPRERQQDPYAPSQPAYAAQPAYGHGYAQQGYDPSQESPSYDYGQQPAQPAGEYAQQHASWQEHDYQQGYQQDAYHEEPPRKSLRAKMLIGAAILVVAGGSAGAYFLRGTTGVGKDAPTILASSGPTKVAPAGQAADGAKPSISILERGASGASQSKVVQNEEQPVDVGATARASGRPVRVTDSGGPVTLAPPTPPPVANSIFAEPKRVKAVSVRPDGSIVDGNTPAAAASAQRAEATGSTSPTPAAGPATSPFPAPRPMDMSGLVAAMTPSNTPGSGQKPAARAPDPKPVTSKPVVKPAAVASAPATTASIPAPSGAGGGFSVQLAGTTSPSEAKDAVDRLTRKYASELGAYRPTVLKAEVGSKTVYRVRVKGLSSDDANTLCARLKAGGGPCFVARD